VRAPLQGCSRGLVSPPICGLEHFCPSLSFGGGRCEARELVLKVFVPPGAVHTRRTNLSLVRAESVIVCPLG
jgi:hypothetical protein